MGNPLTRRGAALTLALGVLLAGATGARPAAPAANCPNAKTCDHYKFFFLDGPRWLRGRDGITRVQFWVNPRQRWMAEARFVSAIRASAATWEAWNPAIRLVYMGTTDLPPVAPVDGYSVIGWGGKGPTTIIVRDGRYLREFDIALGPALYRWNPCAQRENSCTGVSEPADPFGGRTYFPDVQNIVTHELGHALGLGDLKTPEDCELTMYGGVQTGAGYSEHSCDSNNRRAVTLGLGDVLGLKTLYPWLCPPVKRGAKYPAAYSQLCPTIKIYSP